MVDKAVFGALLFANDAWVLLVAFVVACDEAEEVKDSTKLLMKLFWSGSLAAIGALALLPPKSRDSIYNQNSPSKAQD